MPKILLVDDEPNIRWTMTEFLKRAGYEVVSAPDFENALAVFGENEIDVAAIDIILPRRSGIQLLEELHRRAPDLPIIMMTGEPNISHLPDIVRAGAYDFLAKPVTKEILLKAVSRAFEKKRLQDEKRRLEEKVARHTVMLEEAIAERTAELVHARNFLNTVLESSTGYAIIVADLESRLTLFNKGAELMFGREAGEVLGQPVWALLSGDERRESPDPFLVESSGQASPGMQEIEVELKRSDGSRFTASVATTPVQTAEGELLGRLAIIKDLTVERRQAEELRKIQEQLAQKEKIAALGQMAAQVAHEVRNPLSGLRLYAMHLQSKVSGKLPESELSLVGKIIQNIEHLTNTTEQILNVARPLNLTFQPKLIGPMISDVLHLLEPQLLAGRIQVSLGLAETSDTVLQIDEAAIRSALVNLLLNSIQAMSTGGVLTVTGRKIGAELHLLIGDTGHGMTPEQVVKVFEPFFTTKANGLGLGMSFAKRVIEKHQGSLMVASSPGLGTTVEIKLPVAG